MTSSSGARGAILILVLVYLSLLALVSASAMLSAALQVRMAGNEQFAAEARAQARAIANAVAHDPTNFDPEAVVGLARCVMADAAAGCASGGLARLPAPLEAAATDYRVVRRAPAELADVRLGAGEEENPEIRFALFEVQVRAGLTAPFAEAMRGVLLGLTPGTYEGELYGAYWRFPAVDPL